MHLKLPLRLSIGLLAILFSTTVIAQEDPVLFTVENEPVTVGEFNYIYAKTNGAKADYSLASLSEYLELYKKFKLKVHRAKEMKLDTLASLKQELAGYRKQLANNYLIDKEVTNQLIEEVFQRRKQDIRFSHLLIRLDLAASAEDSIQAWNKINTARKALEKQPWEEVVRMYSEDESSQENGGDLGFITSLLPSGFYALETAIYTTPLNGVSAPVRSKLGLHLVKVTAVRPARGEMEAAHILIRKAPNEDNPLAKARIDSIYQALLGGADFAELAKNSSEDRLSGAKGGNIGVFGINRYEKAFEDAAFALAKDGDMTTPVESSSGWHVIKRIKGPAAEPDELAKRRLEPLVKRDERYELARVSMVAKLRKDIGVEENSQVINRFAMAQTDTFFTFMWRPSDDPARKLEPVLTLAGKHQVGLAAFEEFLQKNAGKRVNLKRSHDVVSGVRALFDEFIQDECIKFEEDRLEEKYADFRALMREYEEGILLFEATKRMVWDRAGQDSVGLEKFFREEAKSKYTWGERARVTFYQVADPDKDNLEAIRKFARSKSAEEVLKKFNKGDKVIVTTRELTYEHGKNQVLDQMVWKVGSLSYNEEDKRTKGWSFLKIEEIIPAKPKTLEEARGYVIADYQDKLERDWVKELNERYKIKVNQGAFQKLVKRS